MSIELLTVHEFKLFRKAIEDKLDNIYELVEKGKSKRKWLKSIEVRNMLGISHGTLQNLRNSGELPYSRIQGTLYYSVEDVERILEENMIK